MTKKILLTCLALLICMQTAAFAKKNDGLPEADRIKIAVEVTSSSRYKELPTKSLLENFLIENLVEKNLISVFEPKTSDDLILDEDKIADDKNPAENIGGLLIFDAVELPRPSIVPENFDADAYKKLGTDFVVRCEVLGLGFTKVENETIGTITGIVGGGLSLGGSGNGSRDKTLRRVGTGIGLLGFIGMADITKRTALNTVVNMQFISVDSGEILWQENFIGQAIKHHGSKDYTNPWERVYVESVADSAKIIAKRVNKYVDKVIVRGKSDKSFAPKKISLGKLL